MLFVNGLQFGLIELKNSADEDSTVSMTWLQLQTCRTERPVFGRLREEDLEFPPNRRFCVSDQFHVLLLRNAPLRH